MLDNLPDSNHNTKAPRVSIIKPKRLKYNGDVKPNPKGIISKDGLRITCDICFKSFSKSSFNQHYKFFHINPYICDVCLKTFGNKDYLEYHLKKHYGIRDVDCSDCDRKFHHKIDYFVHYNSKHKVEPETTCTYPNCTAVFKKKRILAEHIKFVHLNERNFLCSVCSKSKLKIM